MSKKNIIVMAVSAAIVVGAAAGAVPIVKHFTAQPDKSTDELSTTYAYVENYDPAKEVVNQTVAAEGGVDSSNVVTTIANVIRQTGVTKANNNSVTKKSTATTTKKVEGGTGIVDQAIGVDGDQLFGYRKSPEGYYYTDDKDCWQSNAGYNEVYDNMAPMTGMFIDQVRIRFTYGGKDWMVQMWKGQYGFLLVGAEIGLYTAPEGSHTGAVGDINHYNCAGKSDWLNMQLDCYFDQNHDGHYVKIFTRPYGLYWWPTGFVKGQLTKYTAPRTELKTKNRITFKSAEMADIFVQGLRQAGFRRAASSTSLADDTYYQNGKDVWVLWSTISEDCFVGLE